MTGTVTVLGSLNLDLVTVVPTLPRRGETVTGGDLRREPGGKGANQAVACARAGATVRMVGACGVDDSGDILVRALLDDGVDTGGVRRLRGVPTGVATILVESTGENVIALAPGANARLGPADVAAACDDLSAGDLLLVQLEVPTDVVRRAAEAAADRGATVVLNAAPVVTDVDDLLAHVDVLVVNEHETRALAAAYGVDGVGHNVTTSAQRLADRFGCLVVATLGPDGVVATRGSETRRVRAPAVAAVDRVGAGDTFTGYLAAAICRGTDEKAALEQAVAAASLTVTRAGAQESIPRLTDVPTLAPTGET